jgi:hypothetical protein
MQYNKSSFGDVRDSLTLSPYVDDFSSSSPDPTEELYIQTESLEFLKTEDGIFLIAEQLVV